MTGTAAAQCGLFSHKSVPVIFEPPCTCINETGVEAVAWIQVAQHRDQWRILVNIIMKGIKGRNFLDQLIYY
jgi:hypothetical protein